MDWPACGSALGNPKTFGREATTSKLRPNPIEVGLLDVQDDLTLIQVDVTDLEELKLGKSEGWMFTASGGGSIVGRIVAVAFKNMGAAEGVDAWFPAFIIAGIVCLMAAIVSLMLKPPAEGA